MPPRPSVPPLLVCALGLWLSCALTYSCARAWGIEQCIVVTAFGVLGAVVGVLVAWRTRRIVVGLLALGIALGATCGCASAAGLHADEAMWRDASGPVRCEALADGRTGKFGSTVLARMNLPSGAQAAARVQLPQGSDVPRFGEMFDAQVSTVEPKDDNAAAAQWRQGAAVQLRARRVERIERSDALGLVVAARARAIDALSHEGSSGVAAALSCGWRGGLDAAVQNNFKAAGLAHLIAVSGAHLSLVAAFVESLLRALQVPRAARAAIVCLLTAAYVCFAALPPSAIRAALMAVAGTLSFAAHRRAGALTALGACIVLFVGLDPPAAVSVPFTLSSLSTLGIALFAPFANAWVARCVPILPRFAREAVALTLASGTLTTPLSAALFAQLPLAAPLANAIVAPLFAPVCAVCALAALVAVAVPPAADGAAMAANQAADALAAAVGAAAQLPCASVPFDAPPIVLLAVSAVGAAALWAVWPRPRVRAAIAAMAAAAVSVAIVLVVIPLAAGDEVVMLDVGQGDAVLVRSGGRALLIDTGNQPELLRRALARHGAFRLDAVLVTHGDDDHMAALADLKGVVPVGRVLLARDALACGCPACARLRGAAVTLVGQANIVGVAAGDALRVGAFALDVVWPHAFADNGGNADSVCLEATRDFNGDGIPEWRGLFMGDAERDELRAIAREQSLAPLDLYKVGHHGSSAALDDTEAAALAPRVALISCGAGNRYGHPKPDTLARLETAGASVYRTDERGDISCRVRPGSMDIRTLR